MSRTCDHCGSIFVQATTQHKYCCIKCRKTASNLRCATHIALHKKKYYEENKDVHILRARKWASENMERRRIVSIRYARKRREAIRRREVPEQIKKTVSVTPPERVKARNTLNNAIAAGIVIRPSKCSKCGTPGNMQAHHDDYAKPFSVAWLCQRCHGRKHRTKHLEDMPQLVPMRALALLAVTEEAR